MQAEAPLAAFSNDLSSGVSSSQPASRCPRALLFAAALKSGARNGLASWRAATDCGTTLRSRPASTTGSVATTSSGTASTPAASSISRLSLLAESETSASSASRARSEVSRAAVLARIVATPSSRLSCSLRCASVLVSSALMRARSSRTSRATTWNFVRTDDITDPRWTAASTSRTARASTGMMPSLSRSRTRRRFRGAVRRALCWRVPRRATDSSSAVPRQSP